MSFRFFHDHFVWWASQKSIKDGKISTLAIAETAFSVAIFWAIAMYYDSYIHIFSSVAITPIALFRSERSKSLGIKWFLFFWNSERDEPLLPARLTLISIGFLFCFSGSYFLSKLFLIDQSGWTFYVYSTFLVIFIITISHALVSLAQVVIPLRTACIFSGLTAGGISAALLGPQAGIISAYIVYFSTTMVVISLDKFKNSRSIPIFYVANLPFSIAVLYFAQPLSIGVAAVIVTSLMHLSFFLTSSIFVISVPIRLAASSRFLSEGIRSFPLNWRQLVFQTDILIEPDIVPGLSAKVPELRIGQSLKFAIAKRASIQMRLFGVSAIIFWFAPALLYRYWIKASFWIYIPLIYLTNVPKWFNNFEERLVWVRRKPTVFDYVGLLLAVLTLAIAVAAAINPGDLKHLILAYFGGELPLNVISLIFVVDFQKLYVWQYFTMSSAILAVISFHWLNLMRNRIEAGGKVDPNGYAVRSILVLCRLRAIMVVSWILIVLFVTFSFGFANCKLPMWVNGIFSIIQKTCEV